MSDQSVMEQTDGGSWRRRDDPGEPSYNMPRISIAHGEVEELQKLFSGLTVLEIGTGLGVSTRAIAETARRVITYDVDPWVHQTIFPELRELGIECLEEYPEDGLTVDAAFIDGLHGRDFVCSDTKLAMAAGASLIVFHDALVDNVTAGAKDGGAEPLEVLRTQWGLGIWRRP